MAEVSRPTYDAEAGTLTYPAQTQPQARAASATELPAPAPAPKLAEGAGPVAVFIDGSASVEAEFGKTCGDRQTWKPAHTSAGTYTIEAWGAAGGAGGQGGAGGAGGYTVTGIDATMLRLATGGAPITVAVGCHGGTGSVRTPEDDLSLSRGGGGGGGGATAVRLYSADTGQSGCRPGKVATPFDPAPCQVFAVAGGGGGGGGGTQGFPTGAGGRGATTGNTGDSAPRVSGTNVVSVAGGGPGGSPSGPTGGKCAEWNGGGNQAACKGSYPDQSTWVSTGWPGLSGPGGKGGKAGFSGVNPPDNVAGGDGGLNAAAQDHDGVGGEGEGGLAVVSGPAQNNAGSGGGGGGGGWGGGGGGGVVVELKPTNVPGSGSGGGGGGSFSYSQGTSWPGGGASPGGADGWVRISFQPGGLVPVAISADGQVLLNTATGWSGTEQSKVMDSMIWRPLSSGTLTGVQGTIVQGADIVAIGTGTGGALRSWSSSDNGSTWTAGGTLPAGITWNGGAATTDHVLVASGDGRVASSGDGGASWTVVDPGIGKVVGVTVLPGLKGVVFAASGRTVVGSPDGGATWQAPLPDFPGTSITSFGGVGQTLIAVDGPTSRVSAVWPVGLPWNPLSAPLPHRASVGGIASWAPLDGTGTAMIIDRAGVYPNISNNVSMGSSGSWPSTNVEPLPSFDEASAPAPAIVRSCGGLFILANRNANPAESQIFATGNASAGLNSPVLWTRSPQKTVPANIADIAC